MINRYYVCDACGHELVARQELHDEKRLKKCPSCKKNKLYQDLTGQHTFVYQEPKTIKHLAAKNTELAGTYERQDKQFEIQKKNDAHKLSKLKKAGLAKDTDEIINRKTLINPDGKNLAKELRPILSEKDKKIKKTKLKNYIEKGVI